METQGKNTKTLAWFIAIGTLVLVIVILSTFENGESENMIANDFQPEIERVSKDNLTSSQNQVDYSQNNRRKTDSDLSPTLGKEYIISIAERCALTDLETEKGYMYFYDCEIPTPLPLCLDDAVVENWKCYVKVVGGYSPYTDDQFISHINVFQKDIWVGRIYVDWVLDKYEPCYTTYYHAEFRVENPPISLDSSHYPYIYSDGSCGTWSLWDHKPSDTIPDKEVDLYFWTYWTGCKLPEQAFTILSVRDQYSPFHLTGYQFSAFR